MRSQLLFAVLTTAVLGCTTAGKAPAGDQVEASNKKPFTGWYQGSLPQAMTAAKEQQKPLFLYWGAVWCPPCNELKSHVFSQPRFAALMQQMIPVYLDGDSPEAQAWADKLHVSGYPTLVLLDKDGNEITRFSEGVDIAELDTALAGALSSSRPFDQVLARAQAGQTDDGDWAVLAFYEWEEARGLKMTPAQIVSLLDNLVARVPASLPTRKAQLAAAALDRAAGGAEGDPALVQASQAVRAHAGTLIDAIMASRETALAARWTLLASSKDIVGWAYPNPSPERAAVEQRWLKAVESIADDPSLSASNRLWLVAPALAFQQLDHPKDPVPPELKAAVETAATNADAEAQDHYTRHAVIDDAAELLSEAGDVDRARQLLVAEAARSDSPWYYQATLAEFERKQGREDAALDWSAKARDSARGPATRLQWIAIDLSFVANAPKLTGNPQAQRLLGDAHAFYDAALQLPDGFSGRSGARANKVAAILSAKVPAHDVQGLVAHYAPACTHLVGDSQSRCSAYFQRLATRPPQKS